MDFFNEIAHKINWVKILIFRVDPIEPNPKQKTLFLKLIDWKGKKKMDGEVVGKVTSAVVHKSDADEDDDNVKQLQQCSSLYLLLQVN